MTVKKFTSISIRTQLIVLAVLLTLPALGIIIYSGLKARDSDYRNASNESQKVADNLSTKIANLTHDAEQLVSILADQPDVKKHNDKVAQAIIKDTLKKYPQYSAILIADAAGSVWATTSPLPPNTTIDDRLYFKNVLLTHKISSGEYVISKTKQAPTIHIACPIINNNKFSGAVILGFNLDVSKSIIEKTYLANTTNYVVTDRNGIILSRGRSIGANVGERIRPADLEKMEKGPDTGTYEFVRIDGERRIVTYHKLWLEGEQAPFLYVRAGLSIEEALAKANSHLLKNVLMLLPFVILSFVVVVVIGKRSIVDQVNLLKSGAEKIASGDLESRVSDKIYGSELGILGQAFDDMAHKIAIREQALLESERNYRDIFNMTHDAIFVHVVTSGEIIEVNKAAERMFGFTRDEILNPTSLDFGTEQEIKSFNEVMSWLRESAKESPRAFERLSRNKSGVFFWVEVVQLATSIAGKRRILSVVRDITERKDVERVKDEMLSAVSHEMRTPLTAILGFLEFILENPVGEEQLRDYLGTIYKEADRLNVLISNFLDMQRLKARFKAQAYGPLDVKQVLVEAAALFSVSATGRKVTIDLPLALPSILGDETLLHQAFVNIISNAIKYSTDCCTIEIRAAVDPGYVTISVRDQGIGIPAESLGLIFDAFYRVDNTSARRTSGTGIGLAIVKEIISEMNGKVWVESTLGLGSIFYVSLPIAGK